VDALGDAPKRGVGLLRAAPQLRQFTVEQAARSDEECLVVQD
jgi:hypothetical protein